MSDLQNIVVIGASAAGHSLVNKLAPTLPATHRVLLVERNQFAVHMPTIVRALVVPGWEDKNLTAPLSQETVFPANSGHRLLCPNSVVELRESSVVLEHEFEGKTEISFDKCIIATGASQPAPMRPPPGSSLEEYKNLLRQKQAEIAAAKDILIVGGGTVGVEVAGEINATYPDKKVTIVHTNSGLLNPGPSPSSCSKPVSNPHSYVPTPTAPKLSINLQTQLAKRGVTVLLSDRVVSGPAGAPLTAGPLPTGSSISLESGTSVTADYVFMSTGNMPNSGLVKAADPSALTSNGLVAVDDLFRVVGGKDGEKGPFSGDYYALGDVASVPAWKTLVNADAEGQALAKIIGAEVNGKNPSRYSPSVMSSSVVVTLGEGAGAGILQFPWIGGWSAPGMVIGMKNNDFFAGKSFFSRFQGAQKVTASA